MKPPHRRRSIRLPGYDYSQPGAYFVTICMRNRESLFGAVVLGEIRLNVAGSAVAEAWKWLGRQYSYVELDEWVIMPNHLHGIVAVHGDPSFDTGRGGSPWKATRTG
jgi:REP element-mobilizing transposase RayT